MTLVGHRRRLRTDRLSIWLTGLFLASALAMILGLIGFIVTQGLAVFWPAPLHDIHVQGGSHYLGLVHRQEAIPQAASVHSHPLTRTLWRIGNRELYGNDFVWISDADVVSRTRPTSAIVVERMEWGPWYGFVQEIRTPQGSVVGSSQAWQTLQRELPAARRRARAIRRLERHDIGKINYAMEQHRLAIRRLEFRGRLSTPGGQAAQQRHQQAVTMLQTRYATLVQELGQQRRSDHSYQVALSSVEGTTNTMPLSAIVRVYQPNRLSWLGRLGVYVDRLREFVTGQPREANSEGGVAPAIFGTVMMTLLMTLVVVPFGVLAALYLHEYAKQGPVVSAVRVAVNNLAGVPSIVFGIFGLGFFCYLVGGTVDRLWFPERLPTPTFGGGGILWASLTLALLTVPVVIVATEEALAAVPNGVRAASLACGATKFQTIWRVVLPSAVPGILTGMILAMARGAGEVAPLMITGVVKLAPELPVDWLAPFVHLERKFMHLGFHIYDVGFQSPNIEASKAMVYMTALLLLGIVVCLNVAAIQIRARLRAQFRGSDV